MPGSQNLMLQKSKGQNSQLFALKCEQCGHTWQQLCFKKRQNTLRRTTRQPSEENGLDADAVINSLHSNCYH